MMRRGEREFPPRILEEVSIGEVMRIRTFMGREGNVVGRLPDGRIILFNKESPYLDLIEPGEIVEAKVAYVAKNYIIVDPLAPPKTGLEGLKESLRELMGMEDWEMAVLAKALLYIIEKLEGE